VPKPSGVIPQILALASTPSGNPPAGALFLYFKSDGLLYSKNSSGVEAAVDQGGGGGAAVQTSAPSSPPTGSLWLDTDEEPAAVTNLVTTDTTQTITGQKTFGDGFGVTNADFGVYLGSGGEGEGFFVYAQDASVGNPARTATLTLQSSRWSGSFVEPVPVQIYPDPATGVFTISAPGVAGYTFNSIGLTGATQASRYVGATTSGAPGSGTFATGDFVIARNGKLWICTSGGSPGTWADPTVHNHDATYQPLDGDLTSIAALTTTSYGRTFLTLADQAALMALVQASSETAQGKIELATQAETNTGTDDARAITPLKFQTRLAAYAQPLDSDLTSIAALTTTSYGRAFLSLADQAALLALLPTSFSRTTLAASGLTGATSASRYVGATASGAPGSGTFAVGDFVVAQNGKIWVCTSAGSPGTWADAAATPANMMTTNTSQSITAGVKTFSAGQLLMTSSVASNAEPYSDANPPQTLVHTETTAPSTPASGYGVTYVKSSDSLPYFKNDGGTEYLLAHAIEPYTFSVTGALTTQTGKSRIYLEGNYIFETCRAAVNTAPTGATILVDVNKNGTTIYTTQSARPTIAISGFSATGNSPAVTTFASGDYITVDVDQIGSTIAGSDLTVTIRLRRV